MVREFAEGADIVANVSYGAPIDELTAALRQRVRWLRRQLAALKHLPSPRLAPAGRIALGITGASIVAQLAVPPALLLARRGSRTRRPALGVLGLEAARIARTAFSPEWRHLGIRDGWRAVLELATDNRVWHSVRGSGHD
ncbi:hypothetical protein [Streptomyces acidiscabies]|uniref:hypothetical protein n=1 Tax=Streptomyces acidiscabies TaxID=42234 RepID=UPI000952FA69|nr:hypothetical protein [Streptomyces acidiscabies]